MGGGANIILYPQSSTTTYIFNNVVVDDDNTTMQLGTQGLPAENTAGYYIFNNTIQGNNQSLIYGLEATPNFSFVTIQNNHLISPTGTPINMFNAANQVIDYNFTQTLAQANAANYISGSTYPFYSPTGGVTLGAGKDLRSLAAGIPSTKISDAATAALSDTSCGVKYDAVNHRVIGPNITPMLRGTKWNIGAYQRIAPPQNLRIVP